MTDREFNAYRDGGLDFFLLGVLGLASLLAAFLGHFVWFVYFALNFGFQLYLILDKISEHRRPLLLEYHG